MNRDHSDHPVRLMGPRGLMEKSLYLASPVMVLALSPLLSLISIIPSHRRDDFLVMAIALAYLIIVSADTFVSGRVRRRSSIAMLALFLPVLWMSARTSSVNGAVETAYLTVSLWSLFVFSGRRCLPSFSPAEASLALSAYVLIVLSIYALTGFSNDAFMELTSVNINSLIFAVMPLFAYCLIRLAHNPSVPTRIGIAGLVVVAFLTGSKQSMFLATALLLIGVYKGSLVRWAGRFSLFLIVVGAIWASSSWVQLRMDELLGMLVGRVNESGSFVNRISLHYLYVNAITEHGFWSGFGMAEAVTGAWYASDANAVSDGGGFMGSAHSPHNSWLRLLVEGGAILVLFMVFYHRAVFKCSSSIKEAAREKWIWNLALISILINSILTESMFGWIYWVSLGQLLLLRRRGSYGLRSRVDANRFDYYALQK